jgi:DNA-binding transcriptional ArsR family regulator
LLEGQRRRKDAGPVAIDDWRRRRGRSTRLAILEALRVIEPAKQSHVESGHYGQSNRDTRVTGRDIATYLHLHPTTVNTHLKQLRVLGIIDKRNRLAPGVQ